MKNTGDGRRVHRVEKEVQSVIGMYLIHGFSQPLGAFVSVAKVIMSGDLRNAKVFISVLPKFKNEDEVKENKAKTERLSEAEDIVDLLNDYSFEFQDKISSELKLRYIPKLKFFTDVGTDKVLSVDKALSDLEVRNLQSQVKSTAVKNKSDDE